MKIDIDDGHWVKNSEKNNIDPVYIDQIEYDDLGHNLVQREVKGEKNDAN